MNRVHARLDFAWRLHNGLLKPAQGQAIWRLVATVNGEFNFQLGSLDSWPVGLAFLLSVVAAAGDSPTKTNGTKVTIVRLTVGGETFTNVVVYNRTTNLIFFEHAQGVGNLRVADLDDATLRKLGYGVAQPAKPAAKLNWKRLEFFKGQLRDVSAMTVVVCAIITVGVYLYTCYLLWLICVKTSYEPGILLWLPGLQLFPLLGAARMSPFWILLPLLAVGASVGGRYLPGDYALWGDVAGFCLAMLFNATWCFRICRVRQKSPLLAVFLLVPGLNLPALLYLAGSK